MIYNSADLIAQTKEILDDSVGFGLPLSAYRCFGKLEGVFSEHYDFVCITECRNCGKLNTTLAHQERGIMMPMSAGAGPECRDERCGDKVSAATYGYFKFASAPDEERQQSGMKADHMARLAAIIDTADQRKQETIRRQAADIAGRHARMEKFKQSRYEIVNPAMEAVGAYLRERGHDFKISLDAPTAERGRNILGDTYIDMQIFRDGIPGTVASPRIAIYFDRTTNGLREEIRYCTTPNEEPVFRTIRDEMTRDTVTEKLISFVGAVFK